MKKSPEPIILTVALVLLALTAAGLALYFPSPQDITGVPSTSPTGKTPPRLKEADIDASLSAWNDPAKWPESTHRLFLSREYLFYPDVYPDGEYIKRVDPGSRSPSGVLISWYQKYGLDFTDPNVDREDPDNDGFSNIVEFKNEQIKASEADGTKSTSPVDPTSHPAYLTRLRLQKYDTRPFRMTFRGVQVLNGVTYFQIYLKDVASDLQPGLKKTGDPLGFENYIIGDYKPNVVSREDPATHVVTEVDEGVLTLLKPDIGESVPLIFRKETDSPESTANFVILMPGQNDEVIKVARGKTFTTPFIEKATFLLIDVKSDGAIIRDQQTKQNINVPLLDPAEWNEVPAPAAQKPSTPASPRT